MADINMDSFATPRAIGFFALTLVIIGNAAGNLFLKIGAMMPHKNALFGLSNWQTIAGIACFAFGIVSYAWALKHIELHVAQIAVSLQYVAVIILAATVLGEQVTSSQWLGIALIGLGLFICTR
jgi:drug/metabolite transporter (DMT)-like permease